LSLGGRRGDNKAVNASFPQLVLNFPHEPQFPAADFLRAPSNEAACAWLAKAEDWPERRLVLWGQAGCGKTHLLRLWAERTGALVLPQGLIAAQPIGTPIAIDDAQDVPEVPLLHVLNAAREAGCPVLLTAGAPPARWPVRVPDLASRLRATTAVEIGSPEDSLLRSLLLRLIADRQLVVAPAVQEWLLLRLPRSPAVLREAVARLDRAALATGGKIGRPLAAAALADLLRISDASQEPDVSQEPQA
jgi:chromosomal replication initiation ATPase DnaA